MVSFKTHDVALLIGVDIGSGILFWGLLMVFFTGIQAMLDADDLA